MKHLADGDEGTKCITAQIAADAERERRFPDPGSHYALDERNADFKPIYDEGEVFKTLNGYERVYIGYVCVYDKNGKYTGQWQPDMLSDSPDADDIWLRTYPSDPCYHELTKEEMESAQ